MPCRRAIDVDRHNLKGAPGKLNSDPLRFQSCDSGAPHAPAVCVLNDSIDCSSGADTTEMHQQLPDVVEHSSRRNTPTPLLSLQTTPVLHSGHNHDRNVFADGAPMQLASPAWTNVGQNWVDGPGAAVPNRIMAQSLPISAQHSAPLYQHVPQPIPGPMMYYSGGQEQQRPVVMLSLSSKQRKSKILVRSVLMATWCTDFRARRFINSAST